MYMCFNLCIDTVKVICTFVGMCVCLHVRAHACVYTLIEKEKHPPPFTFLGFVSLRVYLCILGAVPLSRPKKRENSLRPAKTNDSGNGNTGTNGRGTWRGGRGRAVTIPNVQ